MCSDRLFELVLAREELALPLLGLRSRKCGSVAVNVLSVRVVSVYSLRLACTHWLAANKPKQKGRKKIVSCTVCVGSFRDLC